jgi:hypothetical protein
VAGGSGDAGEGIAGFGADRDFSGTAEVDDGRESLVVAGMSFLSHGDVVEAAGSGAKGLFDGVEAVDNFHLLKSNVAGGRIPTDNGGVSRR